MRLLAFFKREAVLTVAALCALATMVLVPPDAAYLGYIDLRVRSGPPAAKRQRFCLSYRFPPHSDRTKLGYI